MGLASAQAGVPCAVPFQRLLALIADGATLSSPRLLCVAFYSIVLFSARCLLPEDLDLDLDYHYDYLCPRRDVTVDMR
jgi:hypothetical protein